MAKRVLVAYGTKYGATAGIAEKIGEVLREEGLAADVFRADQASGVSGYDAVVLGSAVYIGRWRKEAIKFLKAHEAALSKVPVYVFSSGPTDEGDPAELVEGWTFPNSLKANLDRIGPRDVRIFGGAAQPDRMNALERWMLKNVGASMGDYRDWEAIAAWARDIAAGLAS